MPGRSGVLRPEQMYPAGESDVRARFITTAAVLRIRVAECGRADAAPIVLLHGWGCSLYAFRHVLPRLAGEDYRAISVDLHGHGLSDKPADAELYSLGAMTQHALQVIDALGIDAFDSIGHSMGGRIAVELALAQPTRVGKLLLVNAVGFGDMPHVRMALPLAREGIARRLPAPLPARIVETLIAAVYGRRGTYTRRDVDEYRAPTQFRGFLVASAHLLRRFDWQLISREKRDAIRERSMLLTGSLDRVVQTVRTGFGRTLSEEGWRVREVSDVAHVVHEEVPGEVVAAAMELFGRR